MAKTTAPNPPTSGIKVNPMRPEDAPAPAPPTTSWTLKRELPDGGSEEVTIQLKAGFSTIRVLKGFGQGVVPSAQLLDLASGKTVKNLDPSLMQFATNGKDNGGAERFVRHLVTVGFGGFSISK